MAFDMSKVMDSDHALNAKFAEVFCTIDGRRFHLLSCKNFEGTVNINTEEVPRLGAVVTGHKAVAAEISFTMTIYKVTEMFDDLVEKFIKTAVMPRFDIQVSNEDPAASGIGRSTKVYNNCTLDGDVLQSLADAEGGFIEQEISGFAEDYTRPEKYVNPTYM
ncbi:MAG: hypothetical protein IJL00_04900 [Clostridia bacterium]|nr:hypothetical protein [Clostridia bacterium]